MNLSDTGTAVGALGRACFVLGMGGGGGVVFGTSWNIRMKTSMVNWRNGKESETKRRPEFKEVMGFPEKGN